MSNVEGELCRFCNRSNEAGPMSPLFEVLGNGKTAAQIVGDCFCVTIKEIEGFPSMYCEACKNDLEVAKRFHANLMQSFTRLKQFLSTPKIEITEPLDGNISTVFISDAYIKEEAESDCDEAPLEFEISVEERKPNLRQLPKVTYNANESETEGSTPKKKIKPKEEKLEKQTTSKRKSGLPKKLSEGQNKELAEEKPSCSVDTDVKPLIEGIEYKPNDNEWMETVDTDSDFSIDGNSDSDSNQDSDSEDLNRDDEQYLDEGSSQDKKPRKRRLYYGVKADSQPKRCCLCKDFFLDSHEKVLEHSERSHLRYRVTNPIEIEENPYECSVCYKRFETKKEYLRHQRKMYVDMLHPCPSCDEEFANNYVLQSHIKSFHKKKMIIEKMEELRQKMHMCCACKLKFDSKELLKAHTDEVHLPESLSYDGDLKFKCEVCHRFFKSRQSMQIHQYRMFKMKKFICSLCGKAFKEKAFLRDHENSHRQEKPYECPICNARFSIKGSYDAHVRLHDAREDFKCEYCFRGFRTKSLLKGHLTVHNEDRPFKCHLCPITFTQQRLLDSHIEFHLGNKPFKCQQCPASYRYQRDLRGHIREKHEGILNFQCTYCPKAFNRKKPLMVHLKKHQ
ncbi:gastrula zinc finger protein XlCGF26.1-like [Uranotaenia lowii]|uniref:gastrula zinc finger protein XlCGF26.1-like n=1 Tax=Uranotaenia lowii TaxID=190385 RepID=UPI00247A7059|nr:gastrula zinc finger protein XlCGF26.1-like [Uranotaenia lowii]